MGGERVSGDSKTQPHPLQHPPLLLLLLLLLLPPLLLPLPPPSLLAASSTPSRPFAIPPFCLLLKRPQAFRVTLLIMKFDSAMSNGHHVITVSSTRFNATS
jgi:hypothetical protein